MFIFATDNTRTKNKKRREAMAKPIKETPILNGKDAHTFISNFTSPNKKDSIDEQTRQRMRENFKKINSLVGSM